jgi:hypothetical protein
VPSFCRSEFSKFSFPIDLTVVGSQIQLLFGLGSSQQLSRSRSGYACWIMQRIAADAGDRSTDM